MKIHLLKIADRLKWGKMKVCQRLDDENWSLHYSTDVKILLAKSVCLMLNQSLHHTLLLFAKQKSDVCGVQRCPLERFGYFDAGQSNVKNGINGLMLVSLIKNKRTK